MSEVVKKAFSQQLTVREIDVLFKYGTFKKKATSKQLICKCHVPTLVPKTRKMPFIVNIAHIFTCRGFVVMFSVHMLNFNAAFTVKGIGQSVISPGPEQHNFICKA